MLSLFCEMDWVPAQLNNNAAHPAVIMLKKICVVDFIKVNCRLTESAQVLQSRGEERRKRNRLFSFLSSCVPDSLFCFHVSCS